MNLAFVSGFWLGLSLILAIGAQNAFVLRQGLRGDYVFAVCLICAVSDALFIAVGVTGVGAVLEEVPSLFNWCGGQGLPFCSSTDFDLSVPHSFRITRLLPTTFRGVVFGRQWVPHFC